LNFGNPEKPEVMGEFVGAVEGLAEACKALDFPIVSGNVSLYNESPEGAILPTPAIGGVGLLEDVKLTATIAFKQPGESILLLGQTQGWLGQSAYLREICGRQDGAPPPVDLARERKTGDFVRRLVREGRINAAHDLSEGGLGVALAEMAIAGGLGAKLSFAPAIPLHAFLFGEDQARYLLTATPEAAKAIVEDAASAGIACEVIGVTGGDALTIPGGIAILVEELQRQHEEFLPEFMAGLRAA
jgi:phosphoribosylformylglycinamidine (FGAM) synthase-like enzyme